MTVIVPVYNRRDALQRALDSVVAQTLTDFECIVIDDASDVDLRPLVESYGDARLHYIRRAGNGGPYPARFTGMSAARGAYTLFLDSDWELYPWTLDQARRHLDGTPKIDIVCGLHVRNEDSRLFVRVRNAPVIVTPDEARREELIPDRVAAVRRCVLEGWLQKDPNYFALEGHQLLTAKLAHSQLYVDEPWTLYHASGADRVTAAGITERRFDDMLRFLREHQSLIEDPSHYMQLDSSLRLVYFSLWRARRPEADLAAQSLRARGIRPSQALVGEVLRKGTAKLLRRRQAETYWV